MIIIVCGPPGAGKTTLATRLHERLSGVCLLQSDQFSRRTYERMYERVADDPCTDWLLDGTFYEREWRERFHSAGTVKLVHVSAALGTCLERNRKRDESIDEQGVHVIYREFDTADADVVVDTDRLAPEEALELLHRTVRQWLPDDGE